MNASTLTATYRIVTPMFCSGADQKKAELRLASFKGALRFWWRSLMWNELSNEREPHKVLRERESELFGSSDQNQGQSKIRLRLGNEKEDKLAKPFDAGQVFEHGELSGAHYLGYGVMEAFHSKPKNTMAGQLTRPMIPSGQFTVHIRFASSLLQSQRNEVKNALILLGTLGGLGSKSRKGFGSLSLTRLVDRDTEIELVASSTDRLKKLLPTASDRLPEWTAWSGQSRLVTAFGPEGISPNQLLNLLGREQIFFRSWGSKGRVLGEEREGNFKSDHDLSQGMKVDVNYPARTSFGLPHSYGKGPAKEVAPNSFDRRASPVFIHIHQLTDASPPNAFIAFLPSRFLPDGEQINVFGQRISQPDYPDFWYPINGFLDRLTSDGNRPKHRSGYDKFPAGSQWWKKKTKLTGTEVQLGS